MKNLLNKLFDILSLVIVGAFAFCNIVAGVYLCIILPVHITIRLIGYIFN